MKTFITSDWHLGEDRFELMGRPFATKNQHVRHLIAEHNMMVHPEDLVYMNGDVCYQKSPECLPLVSKFHGRKILIRGNHDRVFTDEQLTPYFEQIIPEGEGIDIDIGGIQCYITHYPTQGRKDRFNLTAHIHAGWKYQLNSLNVGVDVHHFRPVNMNRIPFHFKAICEFYDNDMWASYNEINSQFIGKRGKNSSYFSP